MPLHTPVTFAFVVVVPLLVAPLLVPPLLVPPLEVVEPDEDPEPEDVDEADDVDELVGAGASSSPPHATEPDKNRTATVV